VNNKSNETINDNWVYSTDEIVSIIKGYRSLNSSGLMKKFIQSASSCSDCNKLPKKIPINRLVNVLEFDNTPEEEAEKIKQRYIHFKKIFERQKYSPLKKELFTHYADDKQFYEYVMGDQWPIEGGLSIGVCGWTDASILLSKGKHEIMIVAADWYPLLSQTSFIIEREDTRFLKYTKFTNKLFSGTQPKERNEKWEKLILQAGVYFTNAMLCYRPRIEKIKQNNISEKSFENCQSFLKDQIQIVKPKIIITWGVQPAISAMNALSELTKSRAITDSIKKTFFSPFQITKLGDLPNGPPFRIPVDWQGVLFHPLCHPAMPNRWGKQGPNQCLDYEKLKKLIKDEYGIY